MDKSDTIAVLEDILAVVADDIHVPRRDRRQAALRAAIAAVEVVAAADKRGGSIIKLANGGWLFVERSNFTTCIQAASLPELADKLKGGA